MLMGEQTHMRSGDDSDNGNPLIPAAITDTGCERELNEDRYAVIESASGVAWLVCDGMGGQTGGELAAQLAIDAVRRDLEKYPTRPADVALKSAMLEANRIVVLRRQNPAFANMGTTVVAAMFDGVELIVANIGDSRAYLVRDGAIQQLTTDHTLVQQLVDRGEIKPEEALSHPKAHVLTRCVGAEPGIDIDLRRYWIWDANAEESSDSLVLCSDGLYSLVSDTEIAAIVTRNSPQGACVKLVELSKARGGYDNITIAIVPLGGQLRQTPPPASEARSRKRKRTDRRSESVSGGASRIIRLALVAAAAAFVTLVGFLALKFVFGVNI